MSITEIPITSRDQWLRCRKLDVTASAAGCLLDADAFQTPFQLWAEKKGLARDIADTPAMRRGRHMELVAVNVMKEDHPDWQCWQPNVYLRDAEKRIGATPDLYVRDGRGRFGIVQIKSVAGMVWKKKWIDESTREIVVPTWIMVQAMIERHLARADFALVAALVMDGFGNLDLHEIEIPDRKDVIDATQKAIDEFWRVFDSNERMSPDYKRDGETIKNMRMLDGGTETPINLSSNADVSVAIAKRINFSQMEKEGKEGKDEATAVIRLAMGNHSVATCGGYKITDKITNRKESVIKASSFPVLRVS